MKRSFVILNVLFTLASVFGMLQRDVSSDSNSWILRMVSDPDITETTKIAKIKQEIDSILIDKDLDLSRKKEIKDALDFQGNDENTALITAIINGQIRLAENLINYGADVNKKGQYGCSALHRACQYDYDDVVKSLIEHGADVNAESGAGFTPLRIAIGNDNEVIVKCLIRNYANIDEEDENGYSPLYFAISAYKRKMLELLIEFVDIHKENRRGETALHIAAGRHNVNILKYLLGLKDEDGKTPSFDVNKKNKNGETPLHIAVNAGSKANVELLLEKGANVNEEDGDHCTPLGVARIRGFNEIARILEAAGAKQFIVHYVGESDYR